MELKFIHLSDDLAVDEWCMQIEVTFELNSNGYSCEVEELRLFKKGTDDEINFEVLSKHEQDMIMRGVEKLVEERTYDVEQEYELLKEENEADWAGEDDV